MKLVLYVVQAYASAVTVMWSRNPVLMLKSTRQLLFGALRIPCWDGSERNDHQLHKFFGERGHMRVEM